MLNGLLRANDQEAIATDDLAGKRVELDDGKLLFAMAQLLMHQTQRIERLETALKRSGVHVGDAAAD